MRHATHLSVCLSVCHALTCESLNLESLFLVCRQLVHGGHRVKVKVIGSKSLEHRVCGCDLHYNAFLVHLEPRKRVWWLKLSSYFFYNIKIEADLFFFRMYCICMYVSVWSLVKCDYIFTFHLGLRVLTLQSTPLAMALVCR